MDPQAAPRGGERRPGLLALWLISLAALYVLTLRTSIFWNDAPEFVDVAYSLGVAHPPGSPTYALLGKIATLVPLGGIAVRMHLFSAACAVLALAFCALCVVSLHRRLGGGAASGRLGGILGATLLALAPTFWTYATTSEVYAPFVLFTALIFYLALRWDESRDERFLLAGAFVFGLSGGVHGTAIFFAPALAFLVLTGTPRRDLARRLLAIGAFGVLGASVYVYLPVRAVTEPPFNWGHPDTWERFIAHVTDRKDAQYHFRPEAPWWPYVRIFAANLRAELTVAGGIAALGGLALLLARRRRLGLFTLMFCLGNALFFLRIWTIPDAYLPTYFVAALLTGLCLAALLEGRTRVLRLGALASVAGVLLALAQQAREGGIRVGVVARDSARTAAQANLLPLEPDALVFATTNWFAFRYLQDVEGMRPDVTVLLQGDLARPEFFTPVTAKRFPKLVFPRAEEVRGKSYPFFRAMLRKNLGRSPVYWEPMDVLTPHVYGYLRPWRYLWRFDPNGMRASTPEEVRGYLADLQGFLAEELDVRVSLAPPGPPRIGEPELVDRQRRIYHAYLLGQSAEVFRLQERPADAITITLLALHLTPDNPKLSNELGQLYSRLGRWEPAERMFERAIRFAPTDATPLVNLAILQMTVDRHDAARKTLARALRLDPAVPQTHYQLSVLDRRTGRPEEARRALERAIELSEREADRRAWRSELEALRPREASGGALEPWPPGKNPSRATR